VEVTSSPQRFARMLEAARSNALSVGLVPTMGALHPGHLSLIAAARAECDVVAASIFVNPLQFGPSEDLAAYPRDLAGDVALATEAGVDCLFTPSVEEMYPGGRQLTRVSVSGLSAALEGASRPTHFEGVTTVVAKLVSLAGRCRAYFGEKDYQQLVIVRRMVADLALPAEIVGCPTVREEDGLAMSSRNRRLDARQREVAPLLHRALERGADVVAAGERATAVVEREMASEVATAPQFELDYAVIRDAASLGQLDPLAGELRLLIAARLGRVRLIDNIAATT
jgi:pantoate--beta-alanine ligase